MPISLTDNRTCARCADLKGRQTEFWLGGDPSLSDLLYTVVRKQPFQLILLRFYSVDFHFHLDDL